jgi:AcrR family transcriptional regulator
MRHEKVDMIFQAAVEVFAESGFDQAKMDDIAQMAGVAKGTIYYHFKSKEEMFIGLMNEGMQKLIDCARRNVDLHESPTEQLKALVASHVQFFVQNSKLAKLLINEAFGTKERQRQFRLKVRDYLELIESVLIRGIECGEFSIRHPQEVASSIFGAASFVVLQKIYSLDELSEEEIEEAAPVMISTLHQTLFGSIIKLSQY